MVYRWLPGKVTRVCVKNTYVHAPCELYIFTNVDNTVDQLRKINVPRSTQKSVPLTRHKLRAELPLTIEKSSDKRYHRKKLIL